MIIMIVIVILLIIIIMIVIIVIRRIPEPLLMFTSKCLLKAQTSQDPNSSD